MLKMTISDQLKEHLQHFQKKLLSQRGRKAFLACCLSIVIVGLYTSYLRLARDQLPRIKRRPICPIRRSVDACLHHVSNSEDLFNLCGDTTTPVCDFQDRVYGLVVTNADSLDVASDHTNAMVVLGENIGERMDRFVQTKSRWMIDPIGGSGYELLTSTTDSDRLTLQKELDQSQHKCSNFFYGIISQNGFGSHWHTLGLGLAHTLHYNMTLFTVKTYKNFIPLTTCTRTNLDRAFSEYPPETDFSRWDSSTINFKSVGNEHGDVHALMANVNIINPEFQHRGHFWWRSMLTYYAIRPNFKIREMMRQSSPVATPCISIHVRHSDKLEEAPPIALSEYMKHAYQVKEKTGISNIYLMSDDQQVIEGSKDFPDFQFRYLDMPRSNRGWLNDRKEGMSMDSMERNFLIDILSAAQCQHMVLTYSSNVGRLMAEIAFALQDTEPVVVSLDVPWVMHP